VGAQTNQQQVLQRGGPVPPRDAGQAPRTATGTAAIRGRVFAADSGRPLRRARVQISGPGLPNNGQTTSTDAEGRYEIKNLAGGRYTVTVTRSGYLRLSYGQRRPFEQGRPFDLANGQRADNVDFTLPRMSLVSGRVLDEANVRSARPDQQGTFQIKGLLPGDYLAVAMDYVEDGSWNDPEYLESIRRYGQRIRLAESGTQTVALRLVSPR